MGLNNAPDSWYSKHLVAHFPVYSMRNRKTDARISTRSNALA
jgi:hypothetical protein